MRVHENMALDDYLAIPYILDTRAVRGADGTWVCQLAYEELPECVAEARSPLAALDELEEKRITYITERYRQGLAIPVPRPPLRWRP